MSVVGPGLTRPANSRRLEPRRASYCASLAGSAGPLQVSGRNHTLYSERVRMDANYVRD
jgi:lipopolysaccharide/colanic/teichoic acid biosynthesis glycosyltransferase